MIAQQRYFAEVYKIRYYSITPQNFVILTKLFKKSHAKTQSYKVPEW